MADGYGSDQRSWLRNMAVAAIVGVFLALVGAVGTDRVDVVTRLLFWVPVMLGGSVIGHFLTMLVARIPRVGASVWLVGAVLSVLVSIPVTLLVWGHAAWVLNTNVPVSNLPQLFTPVLIISAAMTALMIVVSQPGAVTHAPPPGAAPQPVRFMERLPPKLGGAVIYAVSAEDHYLRLHTSKGVDLILMRLSDAIVELEGVEGAQTHRSWWVARDAVESARREGDRMVLVVKGGVEAPVSRPNVRPLREAGWY